MAKLSIYNTGTFFRPEEVQGCTVQRVGGGTGFRSVVLALPEGGYLCRVRAKDVEYRPGEFMAEKRGSGGEIEAFEERIAASFDR